MNSEECRTTSSDKLNSNQPQLEGFKRLLVEFDWLPFWLANPHPKASRWSGKESSIKETSVVEKVGWFQSALASLSANNPIGSGGKTRESSGGRQDDSSGSFSCS